MYTILPSRILKLLNGLTELTAATSRNTDHLAGAMYRDNLHDGVDSWNCYVSSLHRIKGHFRDILIQRLISAHIPEVQL